MKTKFKNTLLTVAVMTVFSSSVLAGATFIRNEPNKKVIQTPHYYEFDTSENPNRYGWCGQTALKSAMSAYGYHWDLQSIHRKALEIDPNGTKYGYKRNNPDCQGFDFCPELNLLKEIASKFGFSTFRGNAYNEEQLFTGVKEAIDAGRVVIAVSRTHAINPLGTSWGSTGHFYTIHGYRIQNGVKFLYMRDPVFREGGGATDIHEIPVSTWWRQMKRNSKDGYYIGYFSIKK